MNCPKCKSETEVIDSRPHGPQKIRRRWKCKKKKCGFRFSTIEIYQESLNAEVQAKLRKEVSLLKRSVVSMEDRLDRILKW